MLTWRERKGFLFDALTFSTSSTFDYVTHTGEGWGVTHYPNPASPSGHDLVISDGSSYLFVWDAETREEKRRVRVHTNDEQGNARFVRYINELEYYEGDILANVWYSDEILRIDVETGLVKVVYDFSSLWPKSKRPRSADCFNGIADLGNNKLLVTGKLWPSYYVVSLEVN